MIVPMRHLDLVCLANDREATLERLRSLGVVHLELASSAGETVGAAKGDLADAERAVRLVLKARGKREMEVRSRSVAEVLAIEKDMDCLKAERERLERAIRTYAPYGDFDTALAGKLREKGIELRLLDDGTFDFVCTGDAAGQEQEKPTVRWPEMRLAKMEEKLSRVENRIRIDVDRLAGCDEKDILRKFPSLRDRIDFEQAKVEVMRIGTYTVRDVTEEIKETPTTATTGNTCICRWVPPAKDDTDNKRLEELHDVKRFVLHHHLIGHSCRYNDGE